jgi:maleylpyruvate isomerase
VPDLDAVRSATARMLALVDRTTDLTAPSLLPGWSRAHVVAHLAGNARSHVRMLAGLDQYEAGAEGRQADIEQLAADPAAAVEALHASADELDQAWRDADWSAPVRVLDGGLRPASTLVWAREREVEVHAVDLDAGYRPDDWPEPFLDRLLAELLARPDLPPLTGVTGVTGSRPALAAWLSGRSGGEGLHGALLDLPEWR